MTQFTLTRYLGIAERPLVILINSKYEGGKVFTDVEELKQAVNGEPIYFTATEDDERINDSYEDRYLGILTNKVKKHLP